MINAIKVIIEKDIKLCLLRSSGLSQALLLGLLLIFLFSLSMPPGVKATTQTAATIFWLASAFCQTIIFTMLYSIEDSSNQKYGLLSSLIPSQAIWFAKAITGFCILVIAQLFFLLALTIFVGQSPSSNLFFGIAALIFTDLGIVFLGSLLAAISHGQNTKEAILSIIAYPLFIPLFLSGIKAGTAVMEVNYILSSSDLNYLLTVLAFDGIFFSSGLLLFPFIYSIES